MTRITLAKIQEIADLARSDVKDSLDFETCVRRRLGTADWQHDQQRLDAARAKRARKQLRNQHAKQPT